jgi:hypothetical protein
VRATDRVDRRATQRRERDIVSRRDAREKNSIRILDATNEILDSRRARTVRKLNEIRVFLSSRLAVMLLSEKPGVLFS